MLLKLPLAGLTAVALLALGTMIVQAQSGDSLFLDRFDTNKDGKISRDEVPEGYYRRVFDRMVDKYKLDPKKTYTRAELQKIMGLSGSSGSNSSVGTTSSRTGRGGRSDGPAGKSPPSRVPGGDTRPYRSLVELPAEYREFDKDGDGQIGLYEWPRDRIREFLALDKNQDGFLTIDELRKEAPREEKKEERKEEKKETKPAEGPAEGN